MIVITPHGVSQVRPKFGVTFQSDRKGLWYWTLQFHVFHLFGFEVSVYSHQFARNLFGRLNSTLPAPTPEEAPAALYTDEHGITRFH